MLMVNRFCCGKDVATYNLIYRYIYVFLFKIKKQVFVLGFLQIQKTSKKKGCRNYATAL